MAKFNRRTDEYGGSIDNRARFWVETIERVREAVGDQAAVDRAALRRHARRQPRSGSGPPRRRTVHRARRPPRSTSGTCRPAAGLRPSGPATTSSPRGSRASASTASRSPRPGRRPESRSPRSAGSPNPDTMAEAVRSGVIDIVAAARPSIADPFLPAKIEAGRYDEIRECIGCNICASRFPQSAPIICTQNATLGEEYRRGWHPERFEPAANADRDVLVVGAGPAGMECAMVLGKRGMRRVHLVDEAPEIGGCMRQIAAYPHLGEWGRRDPVPPGAARQARATSRSSSRRRLEAEDVLTYGAEIVVIATGSHWRADGMNGPTQAPIPGAEARERVHARAGLRRRRRRRRRPRRRLRHRRLLHRGGDDRAAPARRQAGHRVTPFPNLGPYHVPDRRGVPDQPRAARRGGRDRPQPRRARDRRRPARRRAAFSPDDRSRWSADAVVLVTQREPDDALYHELAAQPRADRGRGDRGAVSDRRLRRSAVDRRLRSSTATASAREIDSENPAVPLPYLREVAARPSAVGVG